MRGLNLLVIDQLGFNKCQFCGYFFKTGGRKRNYPEVMAGDDQVQQAIEKGKGIVYWNYDVADRKEKLGVRDAGGLSYERRFVCPDCVGTRLSIQPKRIKSWLSEYQRKN